MLAQSMNPAHAAAAHDPGGTSPKKTRGIAGLFADILSRTQKGLGPMNGEKARPFGEDQLGSEILKTARKKNIANEAHPALPSREPRSVGNGSSAGGGQHAHGIEARRGNLDPGRADAGVARERRANSRVADYAERADSPTDAERLDAAKRHTKARRGISSDDGSASAVTAAGAGANTVAVMNPPRAKASLGGVDAEPNGEKKPERLPSEPKVSLLDLRRSVESKRESLAKAAIKVDEAPRDSIKEAKVQGHEAGRELYRELSLDARGASGNAAGSIAPATEDSARAKDFQSLMSERMREAWNGEIVRSAHIVLRDGDAGTIRLRLRPESLGNVKIELNLSENTIRGRIIVESDEAKSAFERNMNDLKDAFEHGGFDSAKLEVFVRGDTGGGSSSGGARPDSSGGPFFSERLRGAVESPAEPATAASAYSRRGGAIDILA